MFRSSVRLIWVAGWSIPLLAQTQIDLRTQSKAVDFHAAPYTKPLKSGSSLPLTCTQGELFFLLTASPGTNVYGCPNGGWVSEGGGGVTTIKNTGTTVGTRSILDLSSGPGVLLATSDTGQSILIQSSLDTAVVQTRSSEQSGVSLLCPSAGGSGTSFTCFLSSTLSAYTNGMVLHWQPDVNGAGGATTLNVDTLGPVGLKLADGITDPGPGDVTAGRLYEIWHDGTNFRLLNPGVLPGVLGETQPACGATVRGRPWFVAGALGVKDTLSVCAKDASNTYAWRTLY
ncbi:MAG: hypothetical protein LAP61_29190 [Acidobacteriia bacterium]|nr:hypothetical protein [Terriglobia bacterium]